VRQGVGELAEFAHRLGMRLTPPRQRPRPPEAAGQPPGRGVRSRGGDDRVEAEFGNVRPGEFAAVGGVEVAHVVGEGADGRVVLRQVSRCPLLATQRPIDDDELELRAGGQDAEGRPEARGGRRRRRRPLDARVDPGAGERPTIPPVVRDEVGFLDREHGEERAERGVARQCGTRVVGVAMWALRHRADPPRAGHRRRGGSAGGRVAVRPAGARSAS